MRAQPRTPAPWSKKTIGLSLLATELQQITRTPGQVTLLSPPGRCSSCSQLTQVAVFPSRYCVSCWSRSVIDQWKVKSAAALRKRKTSGAPA